MTLSRRIVACLDVRGGRVVKGVEFLGLRDVGDPVELAAAYERAGADEIVFLNITARDEPRETLLDLARRAAAHLFIPLTIGGGIHTANDVGAALRAGADKVSINSSAVARPEVLTESAERFGAQCVVASIDAKRTPLSGTGWEVHVSGGRTPTGLDAVAWAARCVEMGAGEIMLTSIDRDGGRAGYDLELTRAVANAVSVPVIASGGAGGAGDIVDVFIHTGADAALVAGILHDGTSSVAVIKQRVANAGFPVRRPGA